MGFNKTESGPSTANLALMGVAGVGMGYYFLKGYSAKKLARQDYEDQAAPTNFSETQFGQVSNRYNPVVQSRV